MIKLGASLPVGPSAADNKRAAFGRAFRAWMDGTGVSASDIRKLCGVSAATVSKWRAGDALPAEPHLHTLERAGFVAPAQGA